MLDAIALSVLGLALASDGQRPNVYWVPLSPYFHSLPQGTRIGPFAIRLLWRVTRSNLEKLVAKMDTLEPRAVLDIQGDLGFRAYRQDWLNETLPVEPSWRESLSLIAAIGAGERLGNFRSKEPEQIRSALHGTRTREKLETTVHPTKVEWKLRQLTWPFISSQKDDKTGNWVVRSKVPKGLKRRKGTLRKRTTPTRLLKRGWEQETWFKRQRDAQQYAEQLHRDRPDLVIEWGRERRRRWSFEWNGEQHTFDSQRDAVFWQKDHVTPAKKTVFTVRVTREQLAELIEVLDKL